VVPLGADLGVGVGSAMELASAHVHMIVFFFFCLCDFILPRNLLTLRDVFFLALSVTMPHFPLRLLLRYDMIIIILRAFFISSWVTFGLSLGIITGLDSGVHWIGMAQVLQYVWPNIVIYYFVLGMLD
jgi:hypothetical protein